jgi:hypothetical protein
LFVVGRLVKLVLLGVVLLASSMLVGVDGGKSCYLALWYHLQYFSMADALLHLGGCSSSCVAQWSLHLGLATKMGNLGIHSLGLMR